MAGDWSKLPGDVVVAIALKLETFEDLIYFSLACRWWNHIRSSIKNDWKAIPTPWLLLAENNKENPECLRKIFNLKNNKCYNFTLPETFETRCSGSAYGWITIIDRCLNVKLFNPISKAHIPFPSLENFPGLHGPESHETRDEYITWCLNSFVEKMIVLKAPQSCRHEFVIVVFCSASKAEVAVARPGDQSWTAIPTKKADYSMVDVVVMDDRVFALYHDAKLVYWNAKEFFNLELAKRIDYSPSQPGILGEELDYALNKVYMVQSGIELIMVIRYKEEVEDETGEDFDYDIVYQTYCFGVFKLDHTDKVWEEIEELPGAALLLGCNSSMCVSSGNYLQESAIYFTDDETEFWHMPKEFAGHDTGVFDIKRSEISRFYEGVDMRSLISPPTLFIPQF